LLPGTLEAFSVPGSLFFRFPGTPAPHFVPGGVQTGRFCTRDLPIKPAKKVQRRTFASGDRAFTILGGMLPVKN
jgi:hypothetical protein